MHHNSRVIVEGLARLPEFAHATWAGDLLFVSGTLGTEGDSLKVVPGGVGPETTQTLSNIERILAAAGIGLDDVVKVSVFMTELAEFEAMNAAYRQFFTDDPPSRITVGAASLALGAQVEIECVAFIHPRPSLPKPPQQTDG